MVDVVARLFRGRDSPYPGKQTLASEEASYKFLLVVLAGKYLRNIESNTEGNRVESVMKAPVKCEC